MEEFIVHNSRKRKYVNYIYIIYAHTPMYILHFSNIDIVKSNTTSPKFYTSVCVDVNLLTKNCEIHTYIYNTFLLRQVGQRQPEDWYGPVVKIRTLVLKIKTRSLKV